MYNDITIYRKVDSTKAFEIEKIDISENTSLVNSSSGKVKSYTNSGQLTQTLSLENGEFNNIENFPFKVKVQIMQTLKWPSAFMSLNYGSNSYYDYKIIPLNEYEGELNPIESIFDFDGYNVYEFEIEVKIGDLLTFNVCRSNYRRCSELSYTVNSSSDNIFIENNYGKLSN